MDNRSVSMLNVNKAYTCETLEQAWEAYKEHRATEYFNRPEVLKSGLAAGEIVKVPLTKPLTQKSFVKFLGITYSTWQNYGNKKIQKDSEMLSLVARIRDEIEDEQISGAMLNVYNPNIVARINGLTENVKIEGDNTPRINLSFNGANVKLGRDDD